jgi:hypothetical protein
MEYKGRLYAKIGNKYLEISHTDEFERLESLFFLLEQQLDDYIAKCRYNAEMFILDNMETSAISSTSMATAYGNVKKIINDNKLTTKEETK